MQQLKNGAWDLSLNVTFSKKSRPLQDLHHITLDAPVIKDTGWLDIPITVVERRVMVTSTHHAVRANGLLTRIFPLSPSLSHQLAPRTFLVVTGAGGEVMNWKKRERVKTWIQLCPHCGVMLGNSLNSVSFSIYKTGIFHWVFVKN